MVLYFFLKCTSYFISSNIIKKYRFEVLPYNKGIYINKEIYTILILYIDDIIFIHIDLLYLKI